MSDIPPIFLLTGAFPPRVGGIADYTARLAENLVALGLQVTVIVGSDHPSITQSMVHVEQLDGSVTGWSLLTAITRRIGGQACIVHTQYQTAAFGMHPAINALPDWLRWRCPQARTVVTCHDVRLPYLFPKAGPMRTLLTHRMIDQSHAAIFADEGDRRWAGEAANHMLIPIGSGVPVVALNGQLDPIENRPFRLGYFGFLNATKGVTTLLQAVSNLAQQNRDVRLVLIGDSLGAADHTNSATRANVEQEIARLGLADRIERTGRLSLNDISLELQRCDALAFPFDDGASYRRSSLTAALAHRRPVLTTLQPSGANGIPGFESGESVLLVPPGDAALMTQALARLIDDEALRLRLSAGAAAASERLQWPKIATAVSDVYATVVNEGVG